MSDKQDSQSKQAWKKQLNLTRQFSHWMAAGAVLALLPMGAASASADPFADVPSGHWAYQAVTQLAKDGIIEGYGDGDFQGNKTLTRYEMAQMVARAMRNHPQVSGTDQEQLDRLETEFQDELDNLNQRVSKLEKKTDNFRWGGSFCQKYMVKYHGNGDQDTRGPWWEKSLNLHAGADIPKSNGWKASIGLEYKMGSGKGNGFNSEDFLDESYNGKDDDPTSTDGRLEHVALNGPLGKTGQYLTFGDFCPWTMNGFVTDANLKGAELEHWGGKFATHIFFGRPHYKTWDSSVNAKVGDWEDVGGWDDSGYHRVQRAKLSSSNDYGDFVRKHDAYLTRQLTVKEKYDWNNVDESKSNIEGQDGSDNDYDYSNSRFKETQKSIQAAVLDYRFDKKWSGSAGWYRFRSAAYDRDYLNIGAGLVNYRIQRNLNFAATYAHGNQGGHDNAWNYELTLNPELDGNRMHAYSAYLAYRYLGPDALIKTNLGDGIGAGQKGWEIGGIYNIIPQLQLTMKYAWGNSITNNHAKRTKFYSCMNYNF